MKDVEGIATASSVAKDVAIEDSSPLSYAGIRLQTENQKVNFRIIQNLSTSCLPCDLPLGATRREKKGDPEAATARSPCPFSKMQVPHYVS